MDSKDADTLSAVRLAAAGVTEDVGFTHHLWDQFTHTYPDFDVANFTDPGREAYRILEFERHYRVDGVAPSTLDEVLAFIRTRFFFSPPRIWFDEHEYRLFEDY
jgi:hypothetical protein